jgi:hypothetical protein
MLTVLVVCGCASSIGEPPLKSDAAPDASAAYVAGKFGNDGSEFAFVLTNKETFAQYILPFGASSFGPPQAKYDVITIKIPPGTYEVSQWVTNDGFLAAARYHSMDYPFIFKATAGSVEFLGKFWAGTDASLNYIKWTIIPETENENDARHSFANAYPALQNLEFSCRFCSD